MYQTSGMSRLVNLVDECKLSIAGQSYSRGIHLQRQPHGEPVVDTCRNYTPARCAFAGFILCATADLGLIYMLGLSPAPYQL